MENLKAEHMNGIPDKKTRMKAFELLQKLKGRLKTNGDNGGNHNHFTVVYGHRNPREAKKSNNDRAVRCR